MVGFHLVRISKSQGDSGTGMLWVLVVFPACLGTAAQSKGAQLQGPHKVDNAAFVLG